MDKKQLNVLMDDLNNRGFHGDRLEQEIARYAALGLPTFSVNFQKQFGTERVTYKLFFERLEGERIYELTDVNAICQLPIEIYERTIKGVKTKQLESQMAEIDWVAYQNSLITDRASAEKEEKIENVNIALAVLLSDENGDGRKIAALLMYKYWPEEMFTLLSSSLGDSLREKYERRSKNFSLAIYPLLTADQVFLMVSERVASLENILMELEIPEKFQAQIRNQLYVQIKGFPEKAELSIQFNTQEHHVSLTIPAIKYTDWYGLDDYKVELSTFPPIAHGIFNGVDSERLDKKLSVIDWKNDPDLVSLSEDTNEMEFDSEVEQLEEELFRLALDPSGKFIADQLRIKHFLGAPFFEATISDEAWQWLAALPTKTVQFPDDIPVSQAIPMMSGRPVLKVSQEWNSPEDTWIKVDFRESDTGKVISFTGMSKADLDTMVDTLPVIHAQKDHLATVLKKGERGRATSVHGDLFFVEVSAYADTLQLYTTDGRPIPFNFKLSPDWKPIETVSDHTLFLKGEQTTARRKTPVTNKRKGTGL